MSDVQRWGLDAHGVAHRVEAEKAGFSRVLRWYVDDELVAEKKTSDDKIELKPEDAEHGVVTLRFTTLGRPRRVTWYSADEAAQAALGVGGIDLDPEPGSPAALHEERVRLHPRRYAAQHVAGGVAKVVLPLLLGLLVVRFAINIPWPDWNLPDLPAPDVPWPNLPDIPWPDLPDWQLPAWLLWVLDKARYVWPIVLAYVVAKGEINRRRRQDELKSELREGTAGQSKATKPEDADES